MMRFWPSKRRWKRIGLGLLILVAILLIANGIMAWRAEWRLRSRLASIRAAGDPASIADLTPQSIPDRENAGAILARIMPRLNEFSKEYGRFYDSPLGKKYDEATDRGEPPTKEQIEAMRAILSKYADVERAIGESAACDKYASQLDFSLNHTAFIDQMLKNVQDARTAARFLGWRNEVLRADGQYEAAVKNGIEALRLARLHENEPTLVAYLVAIAMRGIASEQLCDALAAGKCPPELHAAIDQELARHDDPQQLTKVLKTERAVSADWIHGETFGDHRIVVNVFAWYMKLYEVGVLNAMEEMIQLAPRPWHEVQEMLEPADGPMKPTGHGVMADLLVPALRAAFEAHARSLVVSRSLRIDNALIAFAEKNGREATGLEELGLPREATIDPYSGQPLKLKHTKRGWTVYSVMSNGVDDGGDFMEMKDFGVAPPKRRITQKPDGNAEATEAEASEEEFEGEK